MSNKKNLKKSKKSSVGGGHIPETIITFVLNPNPEEDNLFLETAIAYMKIDFGFNLNEKIVLEGGAQVCNTFNSLNQAVETYQQLIIQKVGTVALRSNFVRNYLNRHFNNVNTDMRGLGFPGANQIVNIIAHCREIPSGYYIHFIAHSQGETIQEFGRLDQLYHLSAHNPDLSRDLNSRVGVTHQGTPRGNIKIKWRLCGQSACNNAPRLSVNNPSDIYQFVDYAAANLRNQVEPRYYMNTEMNIPGRIPPFFQNMIRELKNYLIEDININTDATLSGLNIPIKNSISNKLENACSDLNDDKIQPPNMFTQLQIDSKGKYYSDRAVNEKFSTYPHIAESYTKRNIQPPPNAHSVDYEVFNMPRIYARESTVSVNPGNANSSTNI